MTQGPFFRPGPFFCNVVVDGEVIPRSEIAAEAQNHAAPAAQPALAWHAAARALAIRVLLRHEATRRGLVAAPRDLGAGRIETEEEATIRLLLEGEVDSAPPAETAIRAVYAADPDRFRAPSLFEAAHILFAANSDASARATARARAEAAIATLTQDPDAFDRIAAEQSDCPSRDTGGRLGQLTAADTVPEFTAALREMAPGEITQTPVETPCGLHVLRLDAKADGAPLPYAAARPRIAQALQRDRWVRSARDFVARLLAAADIKGVRFATE